MKRLYSFFFISMAFLTVSACGGRAVRAQLDDIESYIQERPDSALAAISAIDTTTLKTRALRAQYSLLHAIALDKNWVDTTDADVVMPAVEYYSRHGSDEQKAKAYYYLGRIQYNSTNYNDAIISFTRASDLFADNEDYRFKSLIYQAIGDTYGNSYLPENAFRFSELSYSNAISAGDTALAYASLYREASDLYNLKRYHESDSLFKFLLSKKDVINKQTYPFILADYALSSITYKEDYQQALMSFEECLSISGGLPGANYWCAYAYALAITGNKEKSDTVFSQIEYSSKKKNLSYLTWKSRADKLESKWQDAYELLQEAYDYQNNKTTTALKQSAVQALRDYYKLQQQYSATQAKQRKGIIFLLILLLATIIVIAFLIIKYLNQTVYRKRQELMETVQEMLKEKQLVSDLKKNMVSVKQEYYSANRETFKEIGNLYNTYHRMENNKIHSESVCAEIRGFIKKIGIDEENYNYLEERINAHFNDVMLHLRKELPNHKELFFRTACYLFSGFSVNTIALILDIEKMDVYKVRSRLRKEAQDKSTPHQEDFLFLLE